MKRSAVLVSIVVGVGALIFGSAVPAARQPQAVRSAQARTLIASVNVTATEFKFVLNKKTAKRGLVIFRVKNAGKLGHDFQINGRKTRIISPGKSRHLAGDVPAQRALHVQMHSSRPCRRRNGRCLHDHLRPASEPRVRARFWPRARASRAGRLPARGCPGNPGHELARAAGPGDAVHRGSSQGRNRIRQDRRLEDDGYRASTYRGLTPTPRVRSRVRGPGKAEPSPFRLTFLCRLYKLPVRGQRTAARPVPGSSPSGREKRCHTNERYGGGLLRS